MSMVRPLNADRSRLAVSSSVGLPEASSLAVRATGMTSMLPGLRRGELAVCVLSTAVFAAVSVLPIGLGTTWRHLNQGRQIDESGMSAVTHDPMTAVTWLADWIGARTAAWLGLDGLVIAHAGWGAVSVLVAAWGLRRRGVPLGSAAALVGGAALAAWPGWGVIRPQAVALPLAGLVGAEWCAPARRRLWITVPALLALWANLDISFVFGLALCVALAGGTLVDWLLPDSASTQRHGKRLITSTLAVALSAVATLLNPVGLRLWVAAWEGIGGLPLAIRSPSAGLYGGLLLLAVGLRMRSRRRTTWRERFGLLVCALAPILHAPWLAPAALVAVVLAGPRLLRRRRRHRSRSAQRTLGGALRDGQQAASAWRAGLATAMVAGALVWLPASRALVLGEPRPESSIVAATVPSHLAQQLTEQQVTGVIFAPAEWGSYLAWTTEGQVRPLQVWPGPRPAAQVLADQRQLATGGDAAWAVVERLHLRWLVFSATRHAAAYAYFREHPRARVRYLDQQGAVVELLPGEVQEPRW